ncbi:MAG: ABC transporter permease [Candidatus Pacearchaeota archaeon]
MKIYNIFKKNLKIVSRNWSYFVVLFLCPILLILVSGIMLNSNDFNNLRIGVINEDSTYSFEGLVKNFNTYDSLADCLNELTNQKISVCFHVRREGDMRQIAIYLDNTKKIIEYYAKQFILQNILSEETQTFYRTAEELNAKLVVYSNSISETKKELGEALIELDDQEKTLTKYRENLTVIRREFDSFYWPIKNMESTIKNLKNNFNQSKQSLENNISKFRAQKQIIQSNIESIKILLSSRLAPADYSYTIQNFDAINDSLEQIDSSLMGIEQNYYRPELLIVIDNLDLIIANLDAIKETLDRLDSDLALAIQRTQNSKTKINSFIIRLDEVSKEMDVISESLNKEKVNLEFKNAFEISEDPVFLAFPMLVTIIITFTSLVLSNMFTLKQVNQPSYLRDLITPTRDIHFLIADYLTNLFFVSVQVAVLFLIGFYWFGIPWSIIYIFIISVFLAASVLIFIGMSLGYLIKQQSLSILLTISLVILLFIFSDLLVPSVLAGPIIKFFVELNIFVILNKILMDGLVLHKPAYALTSWFSKLLTSLTGFFIIAYLSRKVSKGNVIRKWLFLIAILFILFLTFALSGLQHDFGRKVAKEIIRLIR